MTLRGGAAREAETTRGATCDAVDNFLSDYWAQDELVAAAHDGVALRVVVIPEANGAASALRWLRRHDVTALGAAAEPYLHAKVLVCATARGATAVLGSANFSYDAMHVNHELDVEVGGKVATALWRWAQRVLETARRR